MADETKVHCPVCSYEVGTKEDGTKIKAHKVSGEKCDGSDSEIIDTRGVDAGETFELPSTDDETAPQGDEQSNDEEDSGDDDSEPETGARVFTHTIRVHSTCPYRGEVAWELANRTLTANEAIKAGHVLAGPEAELSGVNPGGDYLHLLYSIPVK